ncbi:MAG: hypothetical protein ACTIH7_16840 [Brevibacterium aurantiacum]
MTDIATTTARDRAERIRAKAADLLQEITEAFENRDHITLGYRTWGEYCRAEFDGRIALPRVKGDRVELCAALVDAGLSQRAVAEATGLSRNTVSKYVAPPAQIEPPLPTVLSRDEAKRLTDELLWNDVELESATAELYQGRAWESLGYESWDDMVKAEWADLKLPMPLEDERQTVAPMAELVAQNEPSVDPYQGLFSALESARTQAGDAWEVLSDEYVAEAIRDGQIRPSEAVESMRRTMLAAKETQTGGHYRVPGTLEEAGEMATDRYVRELVTHHRHWWEIEGFPDRETAKHE